MELTGGQADGADPDAQLAGVVGNISTDPGVNVQEDRLGSPEQESVTNIGEVRAVLSWGTMVTAMVPELPLVSVSGNVEGATAASETVKFGVPLLWPVTLLVPEIEVKCDASPA
jgi:hypothetical protein